MYSELLPRAIDVVGLFFFGRGVGGNFPLGASIFREGETKKKLFPVKGILFLYYGEGISPSFLGGFVFYQGFRLWWGRFWSGDV